MEKSHEISGGEKKIAERSAKPVYVAAYFALLTSPSETLPSATALT